MRLDAPKSDAVIARHLERNYLVIAVLLSVPLVLPMLALALGEHWMLPGWLQWLLATPMQFRLGAAITPVRSDPRLVADAIDLSRRTTRKIHQNLFWAFIFNIVGLPLAAFGLVRPVVAGARGEGVSSVSLVGNTLLLRRWRARAASMSTSQAAS